MMSVSAVRKQLPLNKMTKKILVTYVKTVVVCVRNFVICVRDCTYIVISKLEGGWSLKKYPYDNMGYG